MPVAVADAVAVLDIVFGIDVAVDAAHIVVADFAAAHIVADYADSDIVAARQTLLAATLPAEHESQVPLLRPA